MKFLSDIDVEQGADATFVDNAKALFGTGNDLQIYHDAANSYIDQTGTGKIILNTASTGINVQSGTGETRFTKSGTNSDIKIDDSSQVNKVVLKSSGDSYLIGGDVGIGTTDPLSKLHIKSGTSTLRTAVFESEASSSKISFLDSANTVTNRENQVMIGSVGRKMQFTTGGGIRMTLDMVGRLGLGPANSSPSEILDINGSIRVFEATNGGEIYIEGSTSSRKIVKLDNTSDKGLITLNRIDTTNVAISSDFTEHGHTYFNGLNTNLGVGNTSPSQKLHVTGNARVTGAYYDSNNSAGSNGQVLSSTNSGTTTAWVNASSGGSIGGSIADNQIAVGGATANTIEGSSDFSLIPLALGGVTSARLRVKGRLEMSDNLNSGTANLYMGVGAGGTSADGGNTGVGSNALGDQVSATNQGVSNSALGWSALTNLTLGNNNVAVGADSLFYLTGTGQNDNTVIGTNAARYYSTGTDQLTQSSQGVYIGSDTRASANNISNEIAIGYGALGGGSNTITLGNSSVDTLRIPGLGNTNGYVLTYSTADNGFILAAGGGGGGIGGATVANQVAFGAASSTTDITSDSTFTFAKNGLTGSQATTLFEIGDGDSSDTTSYGSVFITAKQVDDSTSRARFQLETSSNPATGSELRGYLQCSGTSSDVTLLSNANLVLEGTGKVTIEPGSTNDVVMASSSGSGVGIGTTSVSKKLQVNGTIYSEQASGEVMIAGNSAFSTKYITIREGSNYAARWGLQATNDIVTSGVMLMASSKPMAFRSSTNIAFDSVSLSHLIIRASSTNGSANVGIGTDDPQSKLQVNGGIQIADDTDGASADKVGTFKYYTDNPAGIYDYSYVDMCMQTDTNTYEWVNVVTNRWVR